MSSITYLMNVLSHEFRSELKLKTLENQKIFQKKKKKKIELKWIHGLVRCMLDRN